MKVGIITVCRNDWHSLDAWINHASLYKDRIDVHVIVALECEYEYKKKISEAFSASKILECKENVGTTGGYNIGIKYCIESNMEFIGLVAQDISISFEAMTDLCMALEKNPDLGIISPVLIKSGTKDEIEGYGGKIDEKTVNVFPGTLSGISASRLDRGIGDVGFGVGGCNFAKVETYNRVGLQDERLFIYMDEVDYALRVKQIGLRVGILNDVKVWHEHISEGGLRPPIATYLHNRNRLLMKRWHAKKRWFIIYSFRWFFALLPQFIYISIKMGTEYGYAHAIGYFHGLCGITGIPPKRFTK